MAQFTVGVPRGLLVLFPFLSPFRLLRFWLKGILKMYNFFPRNSLIIRQNLRDNSIHGLILFFLAAVFIIAFFEHIQLQCRPPHVLGFLRGEGAERYYVDVKSYGPWYCSWLMH